MKSKIFAIIGIILISISLSDLYSNIVVFIPQEELEEFQKTIDLKGNRVKLDFELLKDSFLLKIKSIVKKAQHKEIFVNGLQVIPDIFPYTRTRKGSEISYIHLPKEIIKNGKNSIEIVFSKEHPPDIVITLSNCRKRIGNDIYILFSDSVILPSGNTSFKTTLSAIILTFLIFGAMTYLLSRIIFLSLNRLFLYQVYSILPFLVFLVSLRAVSNLSRLYQIVITPSYFWTLGLASFFVTEGCLVLRKVLQGFKKKEISFISPQLSEFSLKAISWIKTREFADKSIILFMISLLMSAFFLVLHLSLIAEQFANIAYFSLVIGVIIKFIKFVRDKKDEGYR